MHLKKNTHTETRLSEISPSVSVGLGMKVTVLHMAGEKLIIGLITRLYVHLVVQANIPSANHMDAVQCIHALFTRKPLL